MPFDALADLSRGLIPTVTPNHTKTELMVSRSANHFSRDLFRLIHAAIAVRLKRAVYSYIASFTVDHKNSEKAWLIAHACAEWRGHGKWCGTDG